MIFKSVFVFVTLFAFTFASDVLELSDDDFNTRVAETETTLVMFFAPWYVKMFFFSSGDLQQKQKRNIHQNTKNRIVCCSLRAVAIFF